jgi:hypothetical protein
MADITLDDYSGAVGEQFEMEVNGEAIPVELVEASPLRDSGRPGGCFRLEFLGPVDPAYAQGTFIFRRGEQVHDIFVTAIGRDQAGTRYEAIFY